MRGLFFSRLSKSYTKATAVLVDELHASGFVLGEGDFVCPSHMPGKAFYFFRVSRFDFPLSRTPGPPPFSSMKSTPAAENEFKIFSAV